MSKKLDTEIKSMRAIGRALGALDEKAQRRVLEYFSARLIGAAWVNLPQGQPKP